METEEKFPRGGRNEGGASVAGGDGTARREEDVRLSMAAGLLTLLDMKSPQLGAHCRSVARWGRGMGVMASMSQGELLELELAGLLHDLGFLVSAQKFGGGVSAVKDAGRRAAGCAHPDLGHAVVCRASTASRMSPMRFFITTSAYDGQGYPGHLHGAKIPLFSRMIAVGTSTIWRFFPASCRTLPTRDSPAPNRSWRIADKAWIPDPRRSVITLLSSTASGASDQRNGDHLAGRSRRGMTLAPRS